MHHKRRRRRRGGVKGHCAMCASRTHIGGLRNRHRLTRQEERALASEREQLRELG